MLRRCACPQWRRLGFLASIIYTVTASRKIGILHRNGWNLTTTFTSVR
ncbi:hypothetical protein OESDEN_13229, partial [Oesophagostomum dentatum]